MFREEAAGFSIREINEDSLLWFRSTSFTKVKDRQNDLSHMRSAQEVVKLGVCFSLSRFSVTSWVRSPVHVCRRIWGVFR